jgi:hypothetical protein
MVVRNNVLQLLRELQVMNIVSSRGGGGSKAAQLFELRNIDISFISTVRQ